MLASLPGEKNGMSKKWKFISPSQEIFYVTGNFIKFCREHNLECSGMRKIADTKLPAKWGKNAGWFILRLE